MRFGWSTTTYDRAGEPTSERREVTLDAAELEARAGAVPRASSLQTPPPVSAKKVDGRRAYELARKISGGGTGAGAGARLRTDAAGDERAATRACGRTARAAPTCARSRTIWGRRWAAARTFRNCGALASGEFEIDQARTLAQLEALAAEERLMDALVPAAQLLPGFPSVFVDELTAAQVRQRPQFPGIALPVAAGLAVREGGDADGRTGGHRRGGAAESVSSRRRAVARKYH